MKESKFVRTKIVVGYVLIALIGLTAMIYVWRQTGALLEPDHSQQELRRRRGLVNQTLYHLYEAETYGQMLVAGYASYENRYKRELRLVRECIDSLRMRADDESQQMRLDTIVRLIAGKEQGIKALDRNLRSAGTATLLSENIQRMIPMLDSLSQPTIEPDTILVRDTVRVAPKKKRNFFRRFGDLFSPPKNDSQVVVKTRVRIDAPPRQMSLGDTIAVVLQDLEQRVTSERLALYDKAWREGLRLQRNNQQINQRIYRLIIDFEEEETAYLWERMQAREQVRRSSLVILGSVAAGSLLVMLLFVGILWRDVNRSNRYKRQLEAANRHNEALLEAREKLMLTITHDIKAPLGSIMVYIDLLTRLDLGKRGALYLDHMKSSADHLLELVTDLLDFYKLDSNKVAVNRIAFSPADLFTAVCTGFEPVAAAKGIELRCTLAAELSGQVAGDPSRVRQIAENLLSNAIKFTDRGFVAFDAWLEEGRLLFRVSDTGRGIGPEGRERIFVVDTMSASIGSGILARYAMLNAHLPAGELAGIGVRAVGKPDTGQKLQRGLFCILFRFMQQLHRRNGHVFENRHVREEVKMLEHHAHLLAVEVDVAVFVGDVRAVKENLPAGGKLEQVQTPQECRLAAAGRTDHDHNLAPVNLRGYTVERADFIVLTLLRAFEVLLQLGYLNQNVSGHCCAASSLISRPAR